MLHGLTDQRLCIVNVVLLYWSLLPYMVSNMGYGYASLHMLIYSEKMVVFSLC